MCKCWIITLFFIILLGIILYRLIKRRLNLRKESLTNEETKKLPENIDMEIFNECVREKKKDSCNFSEDSNSPCIIDQCSCIEGNVMKNPTMEDETIAKTTGKTLLNQCNIFCQSLFDCYYKKKKSPYANYLNF